MAKKYQITGDKIELDLIMAEAKKQGANFKRKSVGVINVVGDVDESLRRYVNGVLSVNQARTNEKVAKKVRGSKLNET